MKKLCPTLGLLLVLLAACTTVPTNVSHDIPNLRQVRAGVWRGGTPTSTNGWNYIRYTLNLTNAVKMSLEAEGSAKYAESIGIKVHYFPINWEHQFIFKPSPQVVSNAVYAITTNTYVFCLHGEDRTGLIVACERVWIEGWAKAKAWAEAIADGFHPAERSLADFFEDDVR